MDYGSMRVKDLKALAKVCKLRRYSKLKKDELIALLQEPRRTGPPDTRGPLLHLLHSDNLLHKKWIYLSNRS